MRGGRLVVVVRLDVDQYRFSGFVNAIPRPKRRPHDKAHYSLRVRAIRPDGSTIESCASQAFVSSKEPPAVLGFHGLGAAEIPTGTEIELIGYEIANSTQPSSVDPLTSVP